MKNQNGRWVLGVLLAVFMWHVIGTLLIYTGKNTIEKDNFEVWNQTDRAVAVVSSQTNQLEGFEADRQLLVDKITDARDSRDYAKLDEALLQFSEFRVMVESYPGIDLTTQQVALMDETAGSLSRIATARRILVEDKTQVNNMLGLFPLCQLIFTREVIPQVNYAVDNPMPTFGFE